MDSTKKPSIISFCSGYGGIERGLDLAGLRCRTVALCEIEAYVIATILKRMEEGGMDAAPIWSDLKTFPSEEFLGKVDGITAGYPCQPFSGAGKGLGREDPRHLWPFILEHIKAIEPGFVFLENVRGHVQNGLREVLADLQTAGFRTSWGLFSAAEVGAPHQRCRLFILAYSDSIRREGFGENGDKKGRERPPKGSARLCGGTGTGSHWEAEPAVGRVAHGTPNRTDRLRMLGNGVVPQQAAKAFLTLNERLWREKNG